MKIVIIGGGVAGMMSAITLAESGNSIILLEKNEKLGKKLYITGKGRCNITNYTEDNNKFLENVVSNPRFLMSSLANFSPKDTMDFFENIGLELITERGNRVFPASQKSSDVIRALTKKLESLNVDIRTNTTALDIIVDNNVITAVRTHKEELPTDAVVLATGGISYPSTGSTGDGYIFAKKVGHSIIDPKAALVEIKLSHALMLGSVRIPISQMPTLQGLSLKNVTAKICKQEKVIASDFGEMLFTSDGASGPIILSLSSRINRLDINTLKLEIDLKPALTEEELDKRLLRDFEMNINKTFKNSLSDLLPSSLIPFFIKLSGIDPEKKVNVINKQERVNMIKLLKGLPFQMQALGNIDGAIITAGGVAVKEIDPKTMRSKLINNLYFAGEIIDIDALTGGFNIQIALSTAKNIKID